MNTIAIAPQSILIGLLIFAIYEIIKAIVSIFKEKTLYEQKRKDEISKSFVELLANKGLVGAKLPTPGDEDAWAEYRKHLRIAMSETFNDIHSLIK